MIAHPNDKLALYGTTDRTGRGNDLSLVGTASLANDKWGQGISTPGTAGNYATKDSSVALIGDGLNHTVALWVRRGRTNIREYPITIGRADSIIGFFSIDLGISPTAYIQATFGKGVDGTNYRAAYYESSLLANTNDNCIIATYSSGTLTLNINGVDVGFTLFGSYTGSLSGITTFLRVGNRATTNDLYYQGLVDPVHVYNYVFTQADKLRFYSANKPPLSRS